MIEDLATTGTIKVPVVVSCRVLKVDRREYYRWKNNRLSQRDIDDAQLLVQIKRIKLRHPGFGYRLVACELVKQGVKVSKNRVYKICCAHNIYAHFARKKPQVKKSPPPSCDDLIHRDFTAEKPNEKWVIDITEHPTIKDKTLYCCAVIDLYSKKAVGYSIAKTMTANIIISAVQMGIKHRKPSAGLIIHSDRGGQFRDEEYKALLATNGYRQSMGNAGTSADNAAMESFFALLQKNVLDYQKWETYEELRLAIFTWITIDYNHIRKQTKLGQQSPTEYEKINPAATTA